MHNIYLDQWSDNILLEIAFNTQYGATDPSNISLIVYEEDGADASFAATQITGSPFSPSKLDSKDGFYGAYIPKSELTTGKKYIALWEITYNGATQRKPEAYFVRDSLEEKIDTIDTVMDTINTLLTALNQHTRGRWKIYNNQLIHYDSNGVTPLDTYNLYDSGGNPTSTNPTERVPV